MKGITMYTKIGIFDSGIGCVTVLNECVKLVPFFHYLYYSDSLHNPYHSAYIPGL